MVWTDAKRRHPKVSQAVQAALSITTLLVLAANVTRNHGMKLENESSAQPSVIEANSNIDWHYHARHQTWASKLAQADEGVRPGSKVGLLPEDTAKVLQCRGAPDL